MWKSLISKDKLKFDQKEKVGTIVNFFSEQFLNRDFEVLNLIPINHETYIKLYNIEKVFIDYNLFERNHPWRDFDINDIVDQLKKLNVDIYIINNTVSRNIIMQDVTIINIDMNVEEVKIRNDNYEIPTVINEKQFNIIGKKIKYDILLINDDYNKNHHLLKLYEEKGFKVHSIALEPDSRKKMETFLDAIKSSKVLYLLSVENFNELIIDYIEKLAISMGTIVITSNKIKSYYNYSYTFQNESSLIQFLRATININALLENELKEKRRNVLLKNTFIRYESFQNILNSNVLKENPKVTLFLVMNSSSKIEEFLKDLANQKDVDLQVIIIINNFILTNEELDRFYKISNLDLSFVFKKDTESLGSVFSDNLKNVKHTFICKLTDDIKIFRNLISDLWLSYHYSSADIVGKKAGFVFIPSDNATVIINRDKKNTFTKSAIPQIIFGESEYISKILLPYSEENVNERILKKTNQNNGKIYCNDIYGFYVIYETEKNFKTNDISLEEVYEQGCFYSFGVPDETLLLME